MLWISEILLQRHDIDSFETLKEAIEERARQGEIHFGLDVKPPFSDTPDDWEVILETAFSSAR